MLPAPSLSGTLLLLRSMIGDAAVIATISAATGVVAAFRLQRRLGAILEVAGNDPLSLHHPRLRFRARQRAGASPQGKEGKDINRTPIDKATRSHDLLDEKGSRRKRTDYL